MKKFKKCTKQFYVWTQYVIYEQNSVFKMHLIKIIAFGIEFL